MRRIIYNLIPLAIGLAFIVAGSIYDTLFAGIPYQDPTPSLQAEYQFHSTVASVIMTTGLVLFLAGLIFLISRKVYKTLSSSP
ncbi:hypothetical protein BSZ32_06625 [Rubritalea profundi]|uniref:Uncharacterized protein n=1 Tax=Rubritalea profundi TaxID=1658618 RepID=A0A2S7U0W2_9BACT|nr:hypothetical protein BSZ32_06625 [Rubritalea profundi]